MSYIERCLAATSGPIIAASDYVRALPDLICTWVPRRYVTLGTDGYGRSDTRESLRSFFEVDRFHIGVAAFKALVDDQALPSSIVRDAVARYGVSSLAE